MPAIILFDLDGTLAESKQPVQPDMAAVLARLLSHTRVGIISGGKLQQLDTQAASRLPSGAHKKNLFLLPTSGGALYQWENGGWEQLYEEVMEPDEELRVAEAIVLGASNTGLIDFNVPSYGDRIELRGAQVTLSALGQEAPIADKAAWDPNHEKRLRLRAAIAALLPEYDVKVGGATSIDVTKRGVNKAYAIRELARLFSIPVTDMLYVGDELGEGGNDSVVLTTGIPTHAVANPDETAAFIETLLGY